MDKLDKALDGLESCLKGKCNVCPYHTSGYYSAMDCRILLTHDAYELLKEYKAIKPLVDDISDQVHETAKMFRKDDDGVYE